MVWQPLSEPPASKTLMPLAAPWHPAGFEPERWATIKWLAYGANVHSKRLAAAAGFDDAVLLGRGWGADDAGPLEDIVLDDDSDDPTAPPPPPRALGRRSERITRLAARCACVRFSPDNRSWAAASTEGLVIFSLDETTHFDPSGLELHTTPEAVVAAATRGEHGAALAMALCLNEADLVRGAWQRVPHGQIALVAGGIPQPYIERLLRFLGGELDTSRHVHLVSLWVEQLLLSHGMLLRERAATYEVPLRALAKATRARYDELSRVADANFYALAFLEEQLRLHAQGAKPAA